ncbi:MAG: beta-aspartyl-peptidase [Myxococcales bacterium]|nr:beta-aspartyl-peptidase [Myxococcales bacterium]
MSSRVPWRIRVGAGGRSGRSPRIGRQAAAAAKRTSSHRGRIAAIAPALPEPPAAYGVSSEDLEGRRVIPGLVDAHVHLGGGGGEAGPHTRVPPVMLGELTRAGVTTAVGVLGTDSTTRTVAELVARVLGLRVEGLSAYCYTGAYEVPPPTLTGSVRRDIVYVDPIIGVGELAISDHRSSQPTFDEFVRIAADCHVGGLMSGKAGILHLHLGDGPRGLELVRRALEVTELPARVFHPTHVNRQRRLYGEACALAREGVTIDVTAFPDEDPGDGLSAVEAIARWLADPELPDARLTCSSDGAGCMPVFDGDGRIVAMDVGRATTLRDTIAALVEGEGVALERVLPVFTRNVADLLRLPRKGRLQVGADADLLVLGDDLAIDGVMAGGRWLVKEGAQVVLGTFERR